MSLVSGWQGKGSRSRGNKTGATVLYDRRALPILNNSGIIARRKTAIITVASRTLVMLIIPESTDLYIIRPLIGMLSNNPVARPGEYLFNTIVPTRCGIKTLIIMAPKKPKYKYCVIVESGNNNKNKVAKYASRVIIITAKRKLVFLTCLWNLPAPSDHFGSHIASSILCNVMASGKSSIYSIRFALHQTIFG